MVATVYISSARAHTRAAAVIRAELGPARIGHGLLSEQPSWHPFGLTRGPGVQVAQRAARPLGFLLVPLGTRRLHQSIKLQALPHWACEGCPSWACTVA